MMRYCRKGKDKVRDLYVVMTHVTKTREESVETELTNSELYLGFELNQFGG